MRRRVVIFALALAVLGIVPTARAQPAGIPIQAYLVERAENNPFGTAPIALGDRWYIGTLELAPDRAVLVFDTTAVRTCVEPPWHIPGAGTTCYADYPMFFNWPRQELPALPGLGPDAYGLIASAPQQSIILVLDRANETAELYYGVSPIPAEGGVVFDPNYTASKYMVERLTVEFRWPTRYGGDVRFIPKRE